LKEAVEVDLTDLRDAWDLLLLCSMASPIC